MRAPHRSVVTTPSPPSTHLPASFLPRSSKISQPRALLVTGVLFFVYLFWAYVPDDTLRALGIEYYPDKYWALAIPTWIFASGFLSRGRARA